MKKIKLFLRVNRFAKRTSMQISKRIFAAAVSVAMLLTLTPCVCVRADYGYELPWLWPVPGSYKINCLDYYYNGGIHNAGQCMDIGANGYTGDERLDIVSATSGTVLYIQSKYDETDKPGIRMGKLCHSQKRKYQYCIRTPEIGELYIRRNQGGRHHRKDGKYRELYRCTSSFPSISHGRGFKQYRYSGIRALPYQSAVL